MPVDDYGERAELWIDMNSPVSRNNPGQLYESGVNRIGEFVRRKCESVYNVQGPDAAFATLNDWYNDINPNYAKVMDELAQTPQARKVIVDEAIATSPKVWIPPFLSTLMPSSQDFWNALSNINLWAEKWGVESTPVTYKSLQADGSGKEFRTKEVFAIGSKYVIHLHKIPEVFAPGPAPVNHMGIPTKSTYDAKHYPVTTSPYRYGEDELRVVSMDTPISEVTRFQNLMSNSPTGVAVTITSLLLAEHPTRIKRMPITNGELYKTSVVLNLFHNTTNVLGIESKFTKVDAFEVPEELEQSIWESDITGSKDVRMDEDEDSGPQLRKANDKPSKYKKIIESFADDSIEDASVEEADIPADVNETEDV